MKFISSLNDLSSNNSENAFIVILSSNLKNKNELLTELYNKLKFPYFGFNWDALWDCLRDLDWIKQKSIIIIHSDFPLLEDKDIKIYLEILKDTEEDWKKYEEHDIEFIFLSIYENEIKKYIDI